MKYTADNLPKCFTMFAMGVQYKLTLTENGKYFCDFDRRYYEVGHGLQDIPTLLQSLNNGDWKVLQNLDQPAKVVPNGTDSEGNPTYFDATMLKPLQRVVVKEILDDLSGIIAVTHSGLYEGRTVVIYEEGGYDLVTKGGIAPTDVLEVYAQPDKVCHTYDQRERGKLIWKATVKKTQAQLDAELERASLESSIVARNGAIAIHKRQIEKYNIRIAEIAKELA